MAYHYFSFLIISLIPLILSQSFFYSFYYNSELDQINFTPSDTNSFSTFNIKVNDNYISPISSSNNTLSFFSSQLLTESNLEEKYNSKQVNGTFIIEYYTIKLNDSPLTLIKAYFDTEEKERITEIIIDFFSKENVIEKKILPEKYFINDIFEVEQNKFVSKDSYERRGSRIFETFGFEIIAKNNSNINIFNGDFKLDKIILVNYRKKKLNYLANLSGDIYENKNKTENEFYDGVDKYYDKEEGEIIKKRYDFNLENLPENFDLILTIEILDNEGKEKGEKVVLVKKGFQYPNFRIEDSNPNKNFFIAFLCSIVLAFILSVIFATLALVFE